MVRHKALRSGAGREEWQSRPVRQGREEIQSKMSSGAGYPSGQRRLDPRESPLKTHLLCA